MDKPVITVKLKTVKIGKVIEDTQHLIMEQQSKYGPRNKSKQ